MSAVYDVWGLLRLGSRAVKCELQPSVLAECARLCTECEMFTKTQKVLKKGTQLKNSER